MALPICRYLEKRIGEHSGRQNLPESWKWQKRWFVMTDAKGMLYYFKTADDPPNYRGVINLRRVAASRASLRPLRVQLPTLYFHTCCRRGLLRYASLRSCGACVLHAMMSGQSWRGIMAPSPGRT